MPAIVRETVAPLLKDQPPGKLLFTRPRGNPHNSTSWSLFMGKQFKAWMPPLRDVRTESPLRKGFSTWATNFLALKDMDRFMGRRITGMDPTTAVRYFSNKFNADELAAAAGLIDEKAREILARERKRFVERLNRVRMPSFSRLTPDLFSAASQTILASSSVPAPEMSEG